MKCLSDKIISFTPDVFKIEPYKLVQIKKLQNRQYSSKSWPHYYSSASLPTWLLAPHRPILAQLNQLQNTVRTTFDNKNIINLIRQSWDDIVKNPTAQLEAIQKL